MRAMPVAMVLVLAACGGAQEGGSHQTTAARTASAAGPITPSEGAQNSAEPPPPVAAADAGVPLAVGAPGEDIVSVRPGFRPDPAIRAGRAGGPRSAETLDESCRGYIADAPSHVLKVDATVPGLRVLVSMRGDATLVMQLADGRYLCNDDSEGLNPILAGPFPPGRHRLWVGTYSPTPDGGIDYTIAFTADPALSTTAIEGARPSP